MEELLKFITSDSISINVLSYLLISLSYLSKLEIPSIKSKSNYLERISSFIDHWVNLDTECLCFLIFYNVFRT